MTTSARTWVRICRIDELTPERGVAALVEGQQVAVFRLDDDRVFAVQQKDPFSGANVMSRGIVGTQGEQATVTSPMYKQVWCLPSGECLDAGGKDPVDLVTHHVEVVDGSVRISLSDGADASERA